MVGGGTEEVMKGGREQGREEGRRGEERKGRGEGLKGGGGSRG